MWLLFFNELLSVLLTRDFCGKNPHLAAYFVRQESDFLTVMNKLNNLMNIFLNVLKIFIKNCIYFILLFETGSYAYDLHL